jgi:hypothetical protein
MVSLAVPGGSGRDFAMPIEAPLLRLTRSSAARWRANDVGPDALQYVVPGRGRRLAALTIEMAEVPKTAAGVSGTTLRAGQTSRNRSHPEGGGASTQCCSGTPLPIREANA